MKLSESLDYRNYLRAWGDRDFESAVVSLDRCIDNGEWDLFHRALFLREAAEVELARGDKAAALARYQRAEEWDPGCVEFKWHTAKFLAENLRDVDAAVAKCDELVELVDRNRYSTPNEGTPIKRLRDEAARLRRQLCAENGNPQG
jgi:hypothetical protein